MKAPTLYAMDRAFIWHVATATYQCAADTACGREKLTCHSFATNPEAFEPRPAMCGRCQRTLSDPQRESGDEITS